MKFEIKTSTIKSIKDYAIKHYYLILLLIIIVSAFSVRAIPARFNELPGLDEFYFYRISDYALKNNLQLPALDTMRYHPFGIETQKVEFAATAYSIPKRIFIINSEKKKIKIKAGRLIMITHFPICLEVSLINSIFFNAYSLVTIGKNNCKNISGAMLNKRAIGITAL